MDAELGRLGEERVLVLIREYLPRARKTRSEYCLFDFVEEGAALFIELKSRRCDRDSYPTTIVPLHKIRAAEALSDRGIGFLFVFAFADGDYAIKWPFAFSQRSIQRRDRNRAAEHAEIGVWLLEPLATVLPRVTPAPALMPRLAPAPSHVSASKGLDGIGSPEAP